MSYKNLEELMEDFNGKVYTSATADHKRDIKKEVDTEVFAPIDKVYDKVIELTTHESFDNLFEGMPIKFNKVNAFIYKLERNRVISFIFKHDKDFFVYSYEFKQRKNGHTRFTYIEVSRLTRTIVGLNGTLGSMKYKKEVKNKGMAVGKYLNEELVPGYKEKRQAKPKKKPASK